MTHWTPRYIAGLARAAGWGGDDLAPAVAMALASSAGQDHYASNVIGGDDNERRGLWALTPAEAAPVPPHRLWHPQDNAEAAYGCWASEGGTWGWHPVWWGPNYAPALDFARSILDTNGPNGASSAPGWAQSLGRVQAMSNALFHRLVTRG